MLDRIEKLARDYGRNAVRVKGRLIEARNDLAPECHFAFGRGTYNIRKKQLVSDDGTWALCWRIRRDPDAPISYENQQTSEGYVAIRKIGT